jgi:hypothetical protein
MAHETLEKRLSALELRVQDLVTVRHLEGALEGLRTDLGGQILQLRDEMHVGFSALRDALRGEIRGGDRETRAFIEGRLVRSAEDTRTFIAERLIQSAEDTRTYVDQRLEQRTAELFTAVAAEISETRRQARVLHEEVIARIATIGRG